MYGVNIMLLIVLAYQCIKIAGIIINSSDLDPSLIWVATVSSELLCHIFMNIFLFKVHFLPFSFYLSLMKSNSKRKKK